MANKINESLVMGRLYVDGNYYSVEEMFDLRDYDPQVGVNNILIKTNTKLTAIIKFTNEATAKSLAEALLLGDGVSLRG